MDTTGPRKCVLIIEVSLFQRLKYTYSASERGVLRLMILHVALFSHRNFQISCQNWLMTHHTCNYNVHARILLCSYMYVHVRN